MVSPSVRVYEQLRGAVLRGEFAPRQALKPQELATRFGVSLAVVRESLLRLVGEGLAERLPNRGFAVPAAGAERWQTVAQARAAIEPALLRMAVGRGDLEWEAEVRAAHHRLVRTPPYADGAHYSEAWATAHHDFHRALLVGCGNDVLLDVFERLWTTAELSRRWSASAAPGRDAVGEHLGLEALALRRDGAGAAAALIAHLGSTAAALVEES